MSNYTGYIYSITNKINGKTYIGKSNDLVRRWKEHCYGHGGTAILNKAFKKYGLENFLFDVIAQIPFDSVEELNDVLNQLEVYYISLYNTFNDGYNATAGGEGTGFYHHSEETRKKISQSQIGKVLSEEHKAKCRLANLGNHHTDKTKEAIRQALLNRDHSIYERAAAKRKGIKKNHDMIMKAAAKRRKPILQYDMNGTFIKEYDGAVSVSDSWRANIGACCKGKIPSAYGYIWRYKESNDFPLQVEVSSKPNYAVKSVLQYDKQGNFIKRFSSISEASATVGVNTGNICQCLKGKCLSSGGYVWKYYRDDFPLKIDAIEYKKQEFLFGRTFVTKPISQYTKDGIYVNDYISAIEASKALGIGRSSIRNCLGGLSKTAGGYVWKYKSEED